MGSDIAQDVLGARHQAALLQPQQSCQLELGGPLVF